MYRVSKGGRFLTLFLTLEARRTAAVAQVREPASVANTPEANPVFLIDP